MNKLFYIVIAQFLLASSLMGLHSALEVQPRVNQAGKKNFVNGLQQIPNKNYYDKYNTQLKENARFHQNFLACNAVSILARFSQFLQPQSAKDAHNTTHELLMRHMIPKVLHHRRFTILELVSAAAQNSTPHNTFVKELCIKACEHNAHLDKKLRMNGALYLSFLEKLQKVAHRTLAKELLFALQYEEVLCWIGTMYSVDLGLGKPAKRNYCVWASDGSLAAIDTDGKLAFVNGATFKKSPVTIKPDRCVNECILSPNTLWCATLEGTPPFTYVCLYERRGDTFFLKKIFSPENGIPIMAIAFDNASTQLAIADAKSLLKIYDLQAHLTSVRTQLSTGIITRLLFNQTNTFLACQSKKHIDCLDIKTGNVTRLACAKVNFVMGFYENNLHYCNSDHYIASFNVRTKVYNVVDSIGAIDTMYISKYGNVVALLKDTSSILLVTDLADDGQLRTLIEKPLYEIIDVIISDSGSLLMTVHANAVLLLWDIQKRTCTGSCMLYNIPQKVMFTPCNDIIIQNIFNDLHKLNYFKPRACTKLGKLTLAQAEVVNQCALMEALGDLMRALKNKQFNRNYLELSQEMQAWIEQLLVYKSELF